MSDNFEEDFSYNLQADGFSVEKELFAALNKKAKPWSFEQFYRY